MIEEKSQFTHLSLFSIPNVLGAALATTLITGTYLHGKFLQFPISKSYLFLAVFAS
jgi:hypothetical protein